jgi:hypothetical protein
MYKTNCRVVRCINRRSRKYEEEWAAGRYSRSGGYSYAALGKRRGNAGQKKRHSSLNIPSQMGIFDWSGEELESSF